LPAVQRTYAPMGHTPVLHHTLTSDHLSAVSGITPDGSLYMQVQKQAFRSIVLSALSSISRIPSQAIC
jgi:hypothetical protein